MIALGRVHTYHLMMKMSYCIFEVDDIDLWNCLISMYINDPQT